MKEPICLRDVADSVLCLSQPLLGNKRVSLLNTVPDDVYIMADPDKLKQILHNLVSNAIKFTEDGKVELSVIEETATQVKVRFFFNSFSYFRVGCCFRHRNGNGYSSNEKDIRAICSGIERRDFQVEIWYTWLPYRLKLDLRRCWIRSRYY